MNQLVKAQPYGPNFTITKIECSNHIMRNYLRRIRDIAQKTENEGGPVSPVLRKTVSDKQLRPQTQSFIHKGLSNNSPGNITKAHTQRKERSAKKRKCRRRDNPQKLKRRKLQMSGPDSDYGCIELGLSDLEPDIATKGQSDFLLWKAERLKRLTAPHFGTICKLKKSTKRGKSVVNILYSRFSGTAATRCGLENERNAVEDFLFKSGKKVARCGLFVDLEYPWLAASPDGLVGGDSILEVKWPVVASRLTPEEAIKERNVKFCNIVVGKMFLKEEHAYVY
ncbi:hypothetical protein PR048_016245 [Dryococelus australis]|uniref:YqaJ viral recombinase domain-containing protein n=1 Tax=Dryococelus australis TaxID=614101 RepID=A0ABQ9HJ75_9NEOP|nr:hypothetical protein PR048_016245 [Dryococelus australis]